VHVNGESRCMLDTKRPNVTDRLTTEIECAIAEARQGALGPAVTAFAKRAAAIEFLEVHVIDRVQQLDGEPGAALRELTERAAELQEQLEAANTRFVNRLRVRIHDGRYTPHGLERAFGRRAGTAENERDYDALDLLLAELLEATTLQAERAEREAEMVAYQPTPGRMILELVERANICPDDVLIDLGSGLGWVVIVVSLLRRARAIGVEFEPAFVDYARSSARALHATRAEFVHADARAASLAAGTVFFLYTPFRGQMLQQVLARLQIEGRARPIRVCSYGPCTAELARLGWLQPRAGDAASEHEVVVFDVLHRA
jgi:hypothetical protein